jgi:hypothetical protein
MSEKPYSPEWFDFFGEGSLSSAHAILPFVFSHVRHEAVVDVGCALGAWLRVAQELGSQHVLGVDSQYVPKSKLMITDFVAADLTLPLTIPYTFDLAICLEVAEHLPVSAADCIVATLVQLAPIVLFSAAAPQQGGYRHLNEQWPEYWAEKFTAHGFSCYDAIRKRIWMNEGVEPWYRQNILVFSRQAIDALKTDRVERPLPLIHPALRDLSLLTTIQSLPRKVIRSMRRRLVQGCAR